MVENRLFQPMGADQNGGVSSRSDVRVSHAILQHHGQKPGIRSVVQHVRLWVLVDADRRFVITLLAATVFVLTVLVGLFGPVTVQQFLSSGTSIAEAYIELQTGIITAVTIVLAVNQLILSPDLGPVSLQRQRLRDATTLRSEVEDIAETNTSPTEPSAFLGTIVDGLRKELHQLADVISEGDDEDLRNAIGTHIDEAREDTRRVSEALGKTTFGRIGFIGAAMHYDASRDIRTVRRLENEYASVLSTAQRMALSDVMDALHQYTTAREYFRTLYIRSEFARFSRVMLYVTVPALLVAHYAVGVIGENAMVGTTVGVPNLLWTESAAFTISILPVLVIVSYMARLITVSETSIFISPFTPVESAE